LALNKCTFGVKQRFGVGNPALIRSKLDYGCIVYGSARGSYLQMLDLYRTIHSVHVLVLMEPIYYLQQTLALKHHT